MPRGLTAMASATLPAALLVGCAGLPAAQMALPEPLAAFAPQTLQGLGGGRSGDFVFDGRSGRFERGAGRLSLFDAAVVHARGSGSYRYGIGDVDAVQAACRVRQTSASVGIVTAAPQPWALHCDFGSDGGDGTRRGGLDLAVGGARADADERHGRANFDGVTLTLQSVHRVRGSPLPLQAPIGYVFLLDGRPVGAVELNGAPRLWRPPAGSTAHDAVLHAALALAVTWDGPEG